MSYVNSGHYFVSEIMRLVQDLYLIMEVDDALMQAATEEELINKFEALLQRCRLHNIWLARRKLQFRPIVIFTGYQIVDNDSYRPARKKKEALAMLKPQENLRELRSYLGLVNCFRQFIPDMSQNLIKTRELLKKSVDWIWSLETQAEFDEIKGILNGPLGLSVYFTYSYMLTSVDWEWVWPSPKAQKQTRTNGK